MIRMIQSKSAGHAKQYFREALAQSDYYLKENDQELKGRFGGLLAERLGISGVVDKDIFHALCDNINPSTGGPLTPRTKEERTVGYDVNFHVPKSVSVVHALSGDDHILKSFEVAVDETLKEIEADSMTRVRVNGKDENRASGELIMAKFTHQTARPVGDEMPDPHLHCHAYIFNATYDPVENKIKAAQFRDIKKDMPYYQARFQKRMSDKLIDLGYDIRVTDKAFEISGTPQSVIDHFSKRTNAIGQFAKEHNITDPELLAELGARTRAKKQSGLSMQELKKSWREQISEQISHADGEKEAAIRYSGIEKEQKMVAQDCVNYTLEHSFERASVIQDRRLLANGIQHSIGERHISIEQIEEAIEADKRLIHVQEKGQNLCTMHGVLAEEREMVNLARKGKGRFKPLYNRAPEIAYGGDQGAAIAHVLTTPNQVNIIRGVAGAGKTTSLLELEKHIHAAGKETFFVTPMAKTAREQMPFEGFKNADTVASLITDHQFQGQLQGQVLVVDEAGQLSTPDMTALLHIADRQQCRLLLVGDTRQHNATVRGDALRVINKMAGIPTAEVSKIYRQRNNPEYLAAVQHLADGQIESGFAQLDKIGAIKDVADPLKPHEKLVSDYMQSLKQGKSTLIISPTHQHGKGITREVRNALRKDGRIGAKETMAQRLENMNYTKAEKQDWRKYKPGQIVQFTQNVPGIGRGSVWRLQQVDAETISIKDATGAMRQLPLDKANFFNVYWQGEIGLSKGDQIRITQGGADLAGRRLNNGQSMEVTKLNRDGTVHLRNTVSKANYTISKEFGHIDHAYYSTSHSAQGRTVDTVLISQPADTFSATDAKQFYVSVSRGRENVSVYTDDKEKLLEHASRLGDRTSAMELVGEAPAHEDPVIRLELERQMELQRNLSEKELVPTYHNHYEDYEPRL